ncbi:MAG: peptidylprolyl isomerase [Planctomycetota bacterium]
MEGTHAPSPFEMLWDRYRSLIITVVGAVLLALVGNQGWRIYSQSQVDAKWSTFAVSLGMATSYTDVSKAYDSLAESLGGIELSALEKGMASADAQQKPYYLLAIARKAIIDSDLDRAEKALGELESGYPKHVLVAAKVNAMQSREREEEPENATPAQKAKLGWQPPREGSVVTLMREQIASARGFKLPASFTKPEIPADARKFKLEFGEMGSVTIALMSGQHADTVWELVKQPEGGFWKGQAVDEIQRSTDNNPGQPAMLHLGYASTKDEDITKWTTTEPSEHQLDFEDNHLSHFAGALSASEEGEDKSCADRFWICVDDAVQYDDQRVVFGYVVEGLDVLRTICESTLSAQDEARGRGRPEQVIRVTAVTQL